MRITNNDANIIYILQSFLKMIKNRKTCVTVLKMITTAAKNYDK